MRHRVVKVDNNDDWEREEISNPDILERVKDLNWTKLGYSQTDIYWKGSTVDLGEDVWATILSSIVDGKEEGVVDNSEGIWGFWQIKSPPYEELLSQVMKMLG